MPAHSHAAGDDSDHTNDSAGTAGPHGGERTSARTLGLVALVNLVGFVVELAGGLLFGSVALVGDALHMLFDSLAYVMAFAASYTAARFEGGEEWSYGLHRLEPAAAFLNAVLLLPMVGFIVVESLRRFESPVAIDAGLTLAVALGGLVVNLGSVWVLQGGEMSLNERGAFVHLLGDAGGSVVVVISTVAVAVWDLRVADPVAALVVAGLVLWTAGGVLRESTGILLQRSPVPVAELRADLAGTEGVVDVADLHVWQVCSRLTVASVRVADDATTVEQRERLRRRLHDRLADAGVDHATVELYAPANAPADRGDHAH